MSNNSLAAVKTTGGRMRSTDRCCLKNTSRGSRLYFVRFLTVLYPEMVSFPYIALVSREAFIRTVKLDIDLLPVRSIASEKINPV